MRCIDDLQRKQATNPHQSFIVQAPAGSGKTEILTQRYLRLLPQVQAPEQIIAITFTRKAANEMRERIMVALLAAHNQVVGVTEHAQQTYQYALRALDHSNTLNWQLLNHPARLRILTMDALCQHITHAIPLQEKHICYAKISDKPERHYRTAAHNCLDYLLKEEDYHLPLALLLQHLDNRQDFLLSLLTDLLAKRDQWLSCLYQARLQDKSQFEDALRWIEQHELTRFHQNIPKECITELIQLARIVSDIENSSDSPRYILKNLHDVAQLDRVFSKGLAKLLLTSQNTLRKSFDHHVGLKRGACDHKQYDEIKARSKNLLDTLQKTPGFLEALVRIQNLPEPEYDPGQWQVLQALFILLPLLVAHLQLVFRQYNEVDFTTVAHQALGALGSEETPSDLALHLDNRIHHILVDEFQDTSIQQFQLLTQLVQTWQPDDGKTLFVVGDPMQSIYRFRSAEVGLFLRAKQSGIGPVSLTPLTLYSNFRSTQTIVDWLNLHFAYILPKADDMESGAISFSCATPMKPSHHESFIKALQYSDKQQEAENIVRIALEELELYPEDNIAILVRSRTHLSNIIQVLRASHIAFQGVEVDCLATLAHIADVWSFTQALLRPGNRLAFLAFLRSPWCGLSLPDLHCIANFSPHKPILYALGNAAEIPRLSEDGHIRARFIYKVLREAFAQRQQNALVDWLIHTLNQLHADKVLQPWEHDDLEQYWILLEQYIQDGQIGQIDEFKQALDSLYSKRVTPARLQVMTIHKAKGLEFDSVILPGLNAKSGQAHTPLLRWLKLPTALETLLLVSPLKAAHQEQCLLYHYLGKIEAEKQAYEQQRLFYVAATRAKKRLYLFDNGEQERSGSFRSLLKEQAFLSAEESTPSSSDTTVSLPQLFCLPQNFYASSFPKASHTLPTPSFAFDATQRLLGIVAHEILQWICDIHPVKHTDIPWEMAQYRLKSMGFASAQIEEAILYLQKKISQLMQDSIGRWIIQPHSEEQNEYELLVQEEKEIRTRIIDRTFFDQGIRWVIDFKTGKDEIVAQENHKKQVDYYGALLSRKYPDTPIRGGIYYLMNNHWLAWNITI